MEVATAPTLPSVPTCCSWRALGVDIHLVVEEPEALPIARELLVSELAALDLACSRFRPDSEIAGLDRADGSPVHVSALLADALEVAIAAARRTDGDVDPTVGQALSEIGYDRDFSRLAPDGPARAIVVRRMPNWRDIELDTVRRVVRVPAGVRLDLGATSKAFAADRAAQLLSTAIGGAVLVSLGGDIAVAGPTPSGGWPVRVQDRPGPLDAESEGLSQTIALSTGGLATSSVTVRRWRRGGHEMHHLLDPRTGVPAHAPWRTVSVCADSALNANIASTALLIRGAAGLDRLTVSGLPARLVTHGGEVQVVNGWPRA